MKTHYKRKTRKFMLSARFEPAIPAIKMIQTYTLGHMATESLLMPLLYTKHLAMRVVTELLEHNC